MAENHPRVSRGLRQLLLLFAPYVCGALKAELGTDWWRQGVYDILREDQRRNLPRAGADEELAGSLDIQAALTLFDVHWNAIFKKRLPPALRTWAREVNLVRNDLAHLGAKDFSDGDTWRALDTMARLAEPLDAQTAESIRGILREAEYGSAEGSRAGAAARPAPLKKQPAASIPNAANLPAWREVIRPHPDVAEGRYRNAEFAADLAQVARGEGAREYRDPVEFFGRTFVTEGMRGLLVEALRRVAGTGGEPVIQLKTAFGGGKTHSMLALYHLLRGAAPVAKIEALRPVLAEAGLEAAPKAHVAVLVGTALETARSRRPANLPGVTVSTLWGELACQLALSAGKPELYNFVKEADRKGVSPGSEALTRLFDGAGSCLVLMDELVAYARKLYGAQNLAAGTFENFLTFVQEITEAARASRASLVVASIPESDVEIGGEAGQKALAAIEHTFGRLESVWKPVAAHEGFEVVRRRLFLDCQNPAARDAVCRAFSEMYSASPADFPVEAREAAYLERMIQCYPIHPEVFDRLYNDWATLEHFQRTRGVLRLMAAVIHELWMGGDATALIQPGSLPLDAPAVRDELIRRLKDNWNAIVDAEVDGKNSQPFLQDRGNVRYGGRQVSRRVARAIMLGSAPSVKEQRVRGLEAARVRLGAVQPGEEVAVFNDALAALRDRLTYLYVSASGDRYWYDTRPTLRKTVEDRAGQIAADAVAVEIERRLKSACRRVAPLAGVHVCPASPLDVPDEQAARLVALGPKSPWTGGGEGCPALQAAERILEERGGAPRQYKNMLVFLAPEAGALKSLEADVRRLLAWESIRNDREALNLDAAQNREVEASLKRGAERVEERLQGAWCRLLIPKADTERPGTRWECERLSGLGDGIVGRAAKKLAQEEEVIAKWGPELLLRELENLLWQGGASVEVKKLWGDLSSYCYLPRLGGYEVLEEAIRHGVEAGEYFGYAAAIGGDGRFVGLALGEPARIERSGFLVRREAALARREEEERRRKGEENRDVEAAGAKTGADGVDEKGGGYDAAGGKAPAPACTRFHLTVPLDATRINREVNTLMNEVLNHVAREGKLEIRLVVEGKAPEGFGRETVRTVSENCDALRFGDFGFEK